MAKIDTRKMVETSSPDQRRTLRTNAETRLAKSPSDPDARELINLLDDLEKGEKSMARKSGAEISWESHGHSAKSCGYVDGREVATITKECNHTATDENIYSVKVLGKEIPSMFRYIAEARAAAETKYMKKMRTCSN